MAAGRGANHYNLCGHGSFPESEELRPNGLWTQAAA